MNNAPLHGLGAYLAWFIFLGVVFAPFVLLAWWNEGAAKSEHERNPEEWEQVSDHEWRKKKP